MKTIEVERTPELADAEKAYRDFVKQAAVSDTDTEPDAAILQAAGRFPAEFHADLTSLRKRQAAADTLSNRVPELEKQLAEAKAERQGGMDEAIPVLRTKADFWKLWLECRQGMDPNCHTDARLRKSQLQGELNDTRNGALKVLLSTCDPAIGEERGRLNGQIYGLNRDIKDRAGLAELEGVIARQSKIVEELASGIRPVQFRTDMRKTRELYRYMKGELARAIAERPAAERNRQQDEKARAEISQLQARISGLEASKLDPMNMDWSTA